MNKKLEAELEEWADLAETYPQKSLDKTEAVDAKDVKLRLKRERVFLLLAPHVVGALRKKAKEEDKSISQIVERWLTEKLFVEKQGNRRRNHRP